jgi:hypothetical protein
LVCARFGITGADVRPNWQEREERPWSAGIDEDEATAYFRHYCRGIAMEQQSFTSEFWAALGAIDILLLILAGFFGWKLRSIADQGQLNARDDHLKLAREKQQELAQKLAVVTTESLQLQHQLALHDKGFTELATLQSSIRSTIAAIKRVNESSAILGTTLSGDEPSSYLHQIRQR